MFGVYTLMPSYGEMPGGLTNPARFKKIVHIPKAEDVLTNRRASTLCIYRAIIVATHYGLIGIFLLLLWIPITFLQQRLCAYIHYLAFLVWQ